jgi:hypothetical protein
MDYWTYEDNYPLVSDDGARPYPIFNVVRQMQFALPPGAHVIATDCSNGDLETLASDGPSAGEFSILMVNPVGAGEVTLSGLPARSRVTVVVSDGNEQNRTLLGLGHTSIAGTLKVTIPARSVVTVVGNHH